MEGRRNHLKPGFPALGEKANIGGKVKIDRKKTVAEEGTRVTTAYLSSEAAQLAAARGHRPLGPRLGTTGRHLLPNIFVVNETPIAHIFGHDYYNLELYNAHCELFEKRRWNHERKRYLCDPKDCNNVFCHKPKANGYRSLELFRAHYKDRPDYGKQFGRSTIDALFAAHLKRQEEENRAALPLVVTRHAPGLTASTAQAVCKPPAPISRPAAVPAVASANATVRPPPDTSLLSTGNAEPLDAEPQGKQSISSTILSFYVHCFLFVIYFPI